MTKHLIIVPRWGGSPQHDWYPWVSRVLTEQQLFESIQVCEMPNPEVPTIVAWTDAVLKALNLHLDHLNKVVLAGHSVGCQAALHALQKLPNGQHINSAIFVAAWWDVDKPWETIKPWISAEHNYHKIKAAAPEISVLLSNNDPFTADVAANTVLWQERLHAQVSVITNAKHFNGTEEPAVYELLRTAAVD